MAGEQHHYVPRFLLKNFTHGKKPNIFVYDKSNDKRFRTNIKNIAVENRFYELKLPDGILTLEPELADLETNSAQIIEKLIQEKSIRALNNDEVKKLAIFLAIQFFRTKEHRLRLEQKVKLIVQKLRDGGATEENIEEVTKGPTGVPMNKLIGLSLILDAKEFVPYFLNKVWVLFETTYRHPFFISDNPITLYNEINHLPYGNIGLAVRGIEIYLPISTTLCLGLLCPTIVDEIQKANEIIEKLEEISPELVDSTMKRSIEERMFYEEDGPGR